MRLTSKANRIQVKRAFLQTFFLRKEGVAGKHQVQAPTKAQYLAALKRAKRALMKIPERRLDRLVGEHTKKRLRAYNNAEWYIGTVSTREIGAWSGAGGLPKAWTRDSLAQTAAKVRTGLRTGDAKINKRARRAIPAIISLKAVLKQDPLSLPIIFKAGYGTPGRRGLPRMKGDIDDGNMRSIAYAVSGDKKIRAYIGKSPQ